MTNQSHPVAKTPLGEPMYPAVTLTCTIGQDDETWQLYGYQYDDALTGKGYDGYIYARSWDDAERRLESLKGSARIYGAVYAQEGEGDE